MDNQNIHDAWTMFRCEHDHVSVDRMICDPQLRSAFLQAATAIVGDTNEDQILWALMSMRKKKQLTKNQ